jgi:hypothetical protein
MQQYIVFLSSLNTFTYENSHNIPTLVYDEKFESQIYTVNTNRATFSITDVGLQYNGFISN